MYICTYTVHPAPYRSKMKFHFFRSEWFFRTCSVLPRHDKRTYRIHLQTICVLITNNAHQAFSVATHGVKHTAHVRKKEQLTLLWLNGNYMVYVLCILYLIVCTNEEWHSFGKCEFWWYCRRQHRNELNLMWCIE